MAARAYSSQNDDQLDSTRDVNTTPFPVGPDDEEDDRRPDKSAEDASAGGRPQTGNRRGFYDQWGGQSNDQPLVVYIGNLPLDIVQGDIEYMFQGLTVKSVRMIRDRETDTFKGYAYVEFGDKRSYSTALGYDGVLFGSKVVKINPAQGRRGQGNRRGGPGFDRGGGGRGGFNPRGGERPPYRGGPGGFNNGRGGGRGGYFPQGGGGRGRYGSTYQGSGGPNQPFDDAGGPSPDMAPDAREDEFDGGRGGGGYSRGGGFRGRPMPPYGGGGPPGSYGFRGGPPGFRGGYGPPPGFRGGPGGGGFGRPPPPPQQLRNRTLSSRSDKSRPDPELREPSPDSAAARPKLHLQKRSVEDPLHEQVHSSRNASIFGTGRPRPPSPEKEGATKSSTEKLASPPMSPHGVEAHLVGDVENMHLGPAPRRERHESSGPGDGSTGSGAGGKARAPERGHRSESGGASGDYAEGEHEHGAAGEFEDEGPPPGEDEGFTFQHHDS